MTQPGFLRARGHMISVPPMPAVYLRRIALVCLGAVASLGPRAAADDRAGPGPLPGKAGEERAFELIRQLGAKQFTQRQRAQRELVELGLPAKAALEAACANPDAEIRRRAKQALASVVDLEFEARIEAFLAEGTGPEGHGLPGWRDYCALAGDGPLARRLFGDMQRTERELLQAIDDNPQHAGELLEARCREVAQELAEHGEGSRRSAGAPPATLATLLLVAANHAVPISGEVGNCLYHLCQQRSLEQSMLARNTGDLLRRLLAAWVVRPLAADSLTSYQNLHLALDNNIKEALPQASSLIAAGAAPAHLISWAILTVAKFGDPEQFAVLEPLLNDVRNVAAPNRGGQQLDAQVRDVALAALVHLSGQQLADYGFAHVRSHPSCLFIADSLGFSDPTARDRALRRWSDRSAAHRAAGNHSQ